MKKIICVLSMLFTGVFCTYYINPVTPETPVITACKISVLYSSVVRESSYKGLRDVGQGHSIDFGIDTLPAGCYNGMDCADTNPDTTNCDSIVQFWKIFIGKIHYDTNTCWYGDSTNRWLDTFYFQHFIIGVEKL